MLCFCRADCPCSVQPGRENVCKQVLYWQPPRSAAAPCCIMSMLVVACLVACLGACLVARVCCRQPRSNTGLRCCCHNVPLSSQTQLCANVRIARTCCREVTHTMPVSGSFFAATMLQWTRTGRSSPTCTMKVSSACPQGPTAVVPRLAAGRMARHVCAARCTMYAACRCLLRSCRTLTCSALISFNALIKGARAQALASPPRIAINFTMRAANKYGAHTQQQHCHALCQPFFCVCVGGGGNCR